MLPSSHLIFHESAQAASQRIAREQLEITDLVISEPKVVSEVYIPKSIPGLSEHWDIEFIFFATYDPKRLPSKTSAFSGILLVDAKTVRRSEIARSHEDVLSSAGLLSVP
jgi:hypothetical protein